MIPETKQVQLSQIVFDEAIYPRKGGHDPALVQKYAECIANIEAAGKYIAIATDNTLLDGKHRWLAYRTANKDEPGIEIPAFVYDVHDTHAKLALAVELNSAHGYQLTISDKKAAAISLYNYGYQQETIAKMLSVGLTKVNAWLSDVLKAKKDDENRQIWDMWLACYTETEIGEAVGLVQTTVRDRLKVLAKKFSGTFSLKHLFQEEGWTRPLYNVWSFAKKTNAGEPPDNSKSPQSPGQHNHWDMWGHPFIRIKLTIINLIIIRIIIVNLMAPKQATWLHESAVIILLRWRA